ncbi:MAG: molybdenum cofactor guanylyltransferase [Rhodanobacteraceae bacterium]|nr:molybdenum cofactor guanylyltransferase [Rhodanobacteraceae bacterium]
MDANGSCLGVVLAGGRSQRMGVDKARLLWRGRTLLEHATAMLRDAGCSRVLVSGDYPGYACVPDQFPDRGPLGGLASVVAHAGEARWLVVAIDQPLLDASMLRALLVGLETGMEIARGICRYGEEPLPMALSVSDDTRHWMRHAVSGDAGHRALKACRTGCGCTRSRPTPACARGCAAPTRRPSGKRYFRWVDAAFAGQR